MIRVAATIELFLYLSFWFIFCDKATQTRLVKAYKFMHNRLFYVLAQTLLVTKLCISSMKQKNTCCSLIILTQHLFLENLSQTQQAFYDLLRIIRKGSLNG